MTQTIRQRRALHCRLKPADKLRAIEGETFWQRLLRLLFGRAEWE